MTRSTMHHVLTMGCVVILGPTLAVGAEVASALLRSTDVLVSPFDPIFQFGNSTPAVLDDGDFVFFGGTRNIFTGADTDYYWGSLDGSAPGILRAEDPAERQRQLSDNVDLDTNGRLVYTSNLSSLPPPSVSTNSLWIDDSIQFAEDQAFDIAGVSGFWVNFVRPSLTPDGQVTWKSAYATAPGGDDADRAGEVFFQDNGTTTQVLLQTGDAVPGTGESIALTGQFGLSPFQGNWTVSDAGNHLLTAVTLTPSEDQILLRDGTPVSTQGGGAMRTGVLIPAADVGTTGQRWISFMVNDAAINDTGEWATFCETDTAVNEYLMVRSGVIVHREGDIVDGRALSGIPESIAINNLGDTAFIWDDAIFLNDRLLLKAGDLVDFLAPADGIPETEMIRLGRKLTLGNRIEGVTDVYVDTTVAAGRAIARMTVVDPGNLGDCLSGPGEAAGFIAPSAACLQAYDFAPADGDVDLQDMQAFQNRF